MIQFTNVTSRQTDRRTDRPNGRACLQRDAQ